MAKRKSIHLFFCVCITVSIICATRLVYSPVLVAHGYSVVPHSLFAQDRLYELISFFAESKDKSMHAVSKRVETIFPEINALELYRTKYNNVRVVTHLVRPLCRINDTLVFTDQSQILPARYFSNTYVDQLPMVHINDIAQETEEKEIKQFLKQLQPVFLQEYIITWHNKTHIQLDEKNNNQTCLIRYDHMPNEQLMAQYKKVKELINNGNKQEIPFITDLRFDHQIVMRKGVWGDG